MTMTASRRPTLSTTRATTSLATAAAVTRTATTGSQVPSFLLTCIDCSRLRKKGAGNTTPYEGKPRVCPGFPGHMNRMHQANIHASVHTSTRLQSA